MTPDLSFQTAIRAALIPALAGRVGADAIRSAAIRPETFPAIRLAMPHVDIRGYGAGGQIVGSISMFLHVWTRDDDAEQAQQIGHAVLRALMDPPASDDLRIDEWDKPGIAWVADPAHEALHGSIRVDAVARWRT